MWGGGSTHARTRNTEVSVQGGAAAAFKNSHHCVNRRSCPCGISPAAPDPSNTSEFFLKTQLFEVCGIHTDKYPLPSKPRVFPSTINKRDILGGGGGSFKKKKESNPNLLKLCNFNLIKGHMISSSAYSEKERDERDREKQGNGERLTAP